jgi:hypothetical protein
VSWTLIDQSCLGGVNQVGVFGYVRMASYATVFPDVLSNDGVL